MNMIQFFTTIITGIIKIICRFQKFMMNIYYDVNVSINFGSEKNKVLLSNNEINNVKTFD